MPTKWAKSAVHVCALALAVPCAASEQTAILENTSDSSQVLIRTLAEYDPALVPSLPEGAEPFLANGEVLKSDHRFCFRVVGDRFFELRGIVETLIGQPVKERVDPDDGPKVAAFGWFVVMFSPGSNETVVVGTRKSLVASSQSRNSPPKVTFQLPPKSPVIGGSKIDGWAQVSFKVDCSGRVIDCTVDEASRREFGDAAVEAMRRWHFRPAIEDGQPVIAAMRQRFVWRIIDTREPTQTLPYRMRHRH